MNVRCSVLVALLAVSLAGFARAGVIDTPQQSSTASAFGQELLSTQKAFLDAMERGDADYVRSAVADDVMVIGTNGDSGGKSELVHGATPQKSEKAEPKPILYDFKVVQLDSDSGVVIFNSVERGAPIDRYQHQSYTWVKQGGQWKLKFQQSTVNLWSAHDLD